MNASTDKEETDNSTRSRMVGHFVDLHFMCSGPAFQEEVMQQIFHQVAAVEHIGPGPGVTHRIERHGTLGSGQEVIGQPGIFYSIQWSRVRLLIIRGAS